MTINIDHLFDARRASKKTQADVAADMGTTASAVARFESGGGKKRHSPSLRTVASYVLAVYGPRYHAELVIVESPCAAPKTAKLVGSVPLTQAYQLLSNL